MATKQEQISFVKTVYPAAKKLRSNDPDNTLHPLFVTAQAALETGWKVKGIDNNIFGITVGSSWEGDRKLVQTTEVFSNPNIKFKAPEEVLSITPIGNGKYRYSVKRYFRVYPNLEDCLSDHLDLLKRSMYADAWTYRNDPTEYAKRLVDNTGAKYATDPNYAKTMASMIKMVKNIVKQEGL